jgi:hypothetical protein
MPNFELKALIIRKFGSQVVFSRVVGLAEDRVSRFIHGRTTPTDEEKRNIARKLGVSTDEIFPE